MTRWPRLWRLALGLLLALAGLQPLAAAEPPPLDADRTPYAGEPFFLLTDASFGRDEPAQVRLEVNAPQALRETGGVDIVLYRVPQPLAFLQSQRNLHRIDVAARPAPEGLSNTLTHLWDNLVVKARLAWQQLFSGAARRAVTAEVPALKTPKSLREPSRFEEPPQFRPLPGFEVVQRFRYPVPWARAIAPPPGVRLPGSSSEFLPPLEGNVFVPLGRLAPGLYLVEAMAGAHRAHTLLFVSDTMLVTKASAAQMLVWSAARRDGAAVPDARVVWTDGVGVLGRGSTDAQGLLSLSRAAPEASYVFGEDADGGVFIAENFYVDSEVHNTKVYAFTDRPLYRPGDAVQVKVLAREFTSATASRAVPDAPIELALVDPTGAVLATQRLAFASAAGADTQLLLPANARGGGYELRLTMRGELYTAAFRVADYQKPHFEITWLDETREPRTGAAVAGRLQLRYPDGRPVADARVGLTARVQRLSMVEGTLAYANAFPVKLAQAELRTDAQGVAGYSLPAAEEPSRYLLSALATDGAAYRVRASHEVLVERAGATYVLAAPRQFSAPGEAVEFRITAAPGQAESAPPARWSWLRLEDRTAASGPVADAGAVALRFDQPGSYSLTLRDAQQRVVAAATHVVAGPGQKAPPGSLQIVFDRPLYRPGDEAVALVTFSQPVAQALLTLERDQVDAAALLTGGSGRTGLRAERMNDTQWRVRVPVTAAMAPNITFSVATLEGGELVFQNQGLAVQRERIELQITPQRAVVAPGEVVEVELATLVGGRPVSAEVTLGVVDEMIYVLQPELAPTMDEFFFHARRNNVRTTGSASFIGYDLATRRLGTLPARRQVQERAIKLLERPRRDEVDTAAWMPRLRTGADGRLRVRFTMPDALTRWRLTARALDAAGRVGQHTAWVRSDQAFYAKWTSPTWRREGDAPRATVTLFNQTGAPSRVDWAARGAGVEAGASLTLPPGASTLELPLPDSPAGAATPLRLTLRHAGAVVDTLDTPLRREPAAWRVVREQVVDLAAGDAVNLPPDARNLQATLGRDPASLAFSRIAEALVAQPHGCVEQTASRMLPLGLALGALSAAQQPLAPRLAQQLSAARVSLAQMAGPQAVFGWWGRGMAADPFLTAYAYYADWRAAQALGAPLPPAALQRLLEIYAEQGGALAPLPRALVLHWMQQMGLPVASMQAAQVEALMALPASTVVPAPAAADAARAQTTSLLLARAEPLADERAAQRDPALLLAVQGLGARASAAARAEAEAAAQRLEAAPSPLLQALRLYTRPAGQDVSAPALALLARVQGDGPGLDRAQALLWLHERLGGRLAAMDNAPGLGAPWQAGAGGTGQRLWRWPEGQSLPQRLGPLAVPVADPRAPRHAWLRYETRQAAGLPAMPVRIERTLFRVRPVSAEATPAAPGTGRLGVALEPVTPGTPLSSNALYLDQLTLVSDAPLHRALLEAALPPGATVEPGTWGLDVQGAAGTAAQPLEAALAEATAQGYAVPVEALQARGTLTVRHLVRFAQRGRFVLPPPRVWQMYAPEAQGLDTSGRWARMVVE